MSVADHQRWIVVGAGVAGLLAARRLARSGHHVTVMEASEVVGGRVSRVSVDGLELDAGADSFSTRGGFVEALARELGLGASIVRPEPQPTWVVAPERAYPLPAASWLGVPTAFAARDLRRAIGWRGTTRVLGDVVAPVRNYGGDESIDALARERVGDEATARLIAPVLESIYSRPLSKITLAEIDPDLARDVERTGSLMRAAALRYSPSMGPGVMGLKGGMVTLIDALADSTRSAGATIHTGAVVGAVEHQGHHWTVWVDGDAHRADAVVLAIPRPVVAALVPDVARTHDQQVALVTLVLDAPELDEAPRGTGVVAVQQKSGARRLTHATAQWRWLADYAQGRHVVRLTYGIDNARDARLHALGDAGELLGVPLKESQVRDIKRVQWADSTPAVVKNREPVPGLHLVGSAAGLSGLAAIVAADHTSAFGRASRLPTFPRKD